MAWSNKLFVLLATYWQSTRFLLKWSHYSLFISAFVSEIILHAQSISCARYDQFRTFLDDYTKHSLPKTNPLRPRLWEVDNSGVGDCLSGCSTVRLSRSWGRYGSCEGLTGTLSKLAKRGSGKSAGTQSPPQTNLRLKKLKKNNLLKIKNNGRHGLMHPIAHWGPMMMIQNTVQNTGKHLLNLVTTIFMVTLAIRDETQDLIVRLHYYFIDLLYCMLSLQK